MNLNRFLIPLCLGALLFPEHSRAQTATFTPTPTVTATPTPQACCQGVTELTGFTAPAGMAVDGSNHRLYVADFSNSLLQVFDSQTFAPITQFSTMGPVTFKGPIDVAVDTGGNSYVADLYNQAVEKFDSGYNYVCSIGAGQAMSISGVWWDNNSVYLSTLQDFIYRYDGAGTLYSAGATFGGPAILSHPSGMVKVGNWLYVTDIGNNQLVKFDMTLAGPPAVTVLSGLLAPAGVRTDSSGDFYLTEGNNGSNPQYLDEFNSDFSAQRQCVFTASATFASPWGVAVNGAGNVFVSGINGGAVTVLQGSCPLPSPLPTSTATTTPTVTPTSTATATPSPTPTSTLTPDITSTDTSTPTRTPTVSPSPTPTQTSTPTFTLSPVLTFTPTPPNVGCDQSYAYPDPVTGNSLKVHLQLCQAARVTIRVYNTAGQMAGRLSLVAPAGPNDFPLSVSGWAYGVYYYVVEEDSASGVRHLKPEKFAIVR